MHDQVDESPTLTNKFENNFQNLSVPLQLFNFCLIVARCFYCLQHPNGLFLL